MLIAEIGGFRMLHRFCVDGDIFVNAPRVDADNFLNGYKKMRFQKGPDTCGRGLKLLEKRESNIFL